jgi:CheY-like chemotaxis protein
MLDGISFLYVEDDPLSCQVMQMILENAMGIHDLVIFRDSSNFMARLKALARRPDIILLDVHIRPHNGFEMLDALRADPDYRHTKVVALTASVMNEEVEKLRTKGFDGAIAKPVSVTTLPGLIEQIARGESVWHIV